MATEVLVVHTHSQTHSQSRITAREYTSGASYMTVAATFNLPAPQSVYAFVPGRRDLLKHAMFTVLNSEPMRIEDQEERILSTGLGSSVLLLSTSQYHGLTKINQLYR